MSWPEDVRKADLRIDFYRGSGKGGQHRNKTDSACRITHLPTGLSAQSEDQRSQHQNRATAFRRLAKRLVPLMLDTDKPKRGVAKQRIRTYHEPRGTVKDHRTGKTYAYAGVLDGTDLDKVIRDCAAASTRSPGTGDSAEA